MSRAALPMLVSLTALSLGHAVLHLADGSSVDVDARREGLCASGESPFYLAGWPRGRFEESWAYGVPDHLQATVYAALGLWGVPQSGPPSLTLLSIDKQPDALTFGAVDGEGQAVSLTMPRPVDVRPGFPMPRPVGVPVNLSVTREDTPPGQGFTFKVYPETPEGRAVLELLSLSAQVEANGEEKA